MPDKETLKRVRKDKAEGKSASTQAGEFIREEIHHVREGKHGARSTKQAIAIGLSKARRAGVKLPPRKGRTRAQEAHPTKRAPSPARSAASLRRLKRYGKKAASKAALAKHAHDAAMKRTASERSASAKKAARTRAAHA